MERSDLDGEQLPDGVSIEVWWTAGKWAAYRIGDYPAHVGLGLTHAEAVRDWHRQMEQRAQEDRRGTD